MQVFKFGGASVKDAASVRNVAKILKQRTPEPHAVVISAMAKTTNKLEEMVRAYWKGSNDVERVFDELKEFHLNIVRELFGDRSAAVIDTLQNVFVEMHWILEERPAYSYDHHYDQLVSQGEILSTRIVSAYLAQEGIANAWLDARDIIQTDNTYREGKVDFELSASLCERRLKPLLANPGLVITQGFIGGTSENFTTTLGREGSDYTAALLAYFTDAAAVTIWKDVPGVMNADPKFFKNATRINALSYHDTIELAYYGATVIHPKTIKPLQNKNIPLFVKSFVDPEGRGTIVKDNEHRSPVTSYIFKDNQLLISIMPKDFSFIAEENLSSIFSEFSKHHVRINLMQNSALSFSVCVDHDAQKTDALINELKAHFKVLYNDNVQLMTVRNYDHDTVQKLTEGKDILMEQRSRNTHQVVMRL